MPIFKDVLLKTELDNYLEFQASICKKKYLYDSFCKILSESSNECSQNFEKGRYNRVELRKLFLSNYFCRT